MDKDEAKKRIEERVARYAKMTAADRRNLNEAQNCKDFILPLFRALGWDVESDEVIAEQNIKGKRADYTFRPNGVAKFFLEAKKPGVDLNEKRWGEQAISYAWHKSVAWAVLTNFESIKVFNAEWDEIDPERNLVFEIAYKDYATSEKLWLLSRESFEKGELDAWAEKEFRKPKRENVDSQLAKDLLRWRDGLFEKFTAWNGKSVAGKQMAKVVQSLLDRLIFIRTTEDRGFENEHLREILRNREERVEGKTDLEKELKDLFLKYNDWYDSKLFEPGNLADNVEYEEESLKKVIDELYQNPKGIRYNFAEIGTDVLGSIYEQYLGKVQQGETQTSKRKQQGIYYTPRYVVDFIVRNTIGEAVKGKLAHEVADMTVLDPACGSGSFLTRAFEFLNQTFQRQGWDSPGTPLAVIPQCVYGVDLDEEAVEIAQLNLLLRMVYQRERLPNLNNNIECGNSLISDEAMKDKRPFDWHRRFADVFKNGGFDVIIGNPPYIKEYVDKSAFDGLHGNPYYQGKMDLWTLFACQAIDHLKDGGYFSFIAPNNWLTNAGAGIFRDKILQEGEVISFIDFGDFKVFQDAGIQTMIFIFKKGKPRDSYPLRYAKIADSELPESAVAAFLQNQDAKITGIESFTTDFHPAEHVGTSIVFTTAENKGPIEKMRSKSEFKLEDDEVAQGIVGDPDKAFIFNAKDIFNDNENKILKAYFTSVERYSSGENRGSLAYLDKKQSSISPFSAIQAQLENYKEDLENRREVKSKRIEWFQLHWPRDEKFFKAGSKIVCGIRVRQPSFYYTEDEYYGSRALNFIKTSRIDLKYLTGILNSRALRFWFFNQGKRLGDLLQMDKGPLMQAPIPLASADIQKKVCAYVEDLQKQVQKISSLDAILDREEIETLEKQLAETDAELDRLVYAIFGFTPEEIDIIKNS